MIITCDNCSKRYLLDEAALGTGERILRCAACAHSWTYVPVTGQETLVASIAQNSDGRVDNGTSRGAYRSWGLVVGLMVSVLVVSAYMGRSHIVSMWPSVLPLFQFLGVPTHSGAQGLTLRGVHPLQSIEKSGQKKVVLVGEIVNTSPHATSLIPLQIKGYGACQSASFFARSKAKVVGLFTKKDTGCVLVSWTHSLTESRLLPQEHLSFQTIPHFLPSGVERVSLEF
jgi:predicted Zn finger-like uncharacterized protein